MDEVGTSKTQKTDLKDIACRHFSPLFSSSIPSSATLDVILNTVFLSITPSQNVNLSVPFISTEVTLAIKQFYPSKSPGSDGFPAFFYQKFWLKFGNSVITLILDILNHKKSLMRFTTPIYRSSQRQNTQLKSLNFTLLVYEMLFIS